MATLYAKAAGGNWSAAGTWSNVNSAGADNSGPPTAADNVILEAGSGQVTIDANTNCRSLDCTSGTGSYTNTLTHNAVTLTIGDGTAGIGNVALKFSAGMTLTVTGGVSAQLNFASTNATQQTITSAGKSIGGLGINGSSSSYLFSDDITGSGTLTGSNGTLNTNGKNVTFRTLAWNTANFILTLGATTFTCSSLGWGAFAGGTLNAGTSTIILTGSSFSGAGLTYNNVTINVSTGADSTISGTNTFANLTVTGPANKLRAVLFAANQTITSTLTINGNAITNRILIQSDVLGTARTISAATLVTQYTDWQDITAAGVADWNLTHQSINSFGDALGNTGIIFTTAATQFHKTAITSNWDDATKWFLGTNGTGGAGRVPLPQDDCVFDANSITATGKTIQANMPRLGRNINFTGVTNGPSLSIVNTTSIFGSLTLSNVMIGPVSAQPISFYGRSSSTLKSAGLTINSNVFVETFGSTFTLQDDITLGTTILTLDNGTFDAAGFNVTVNQFASNGTSVRTLTMGSGTWTITGNNTTIWNEGTLTNYILNRGNPVIFNYSGSTGSRQINIGLTGGNESNAIDVNITGGSDTISVGGSSATRNLDFTGFGGSLAIGNLAIYGNLTFASGMSMVSDTTRNITFSASSGTQVFRTNGISVLKRITIACSGTTQLFDNLTTDPAARISLTTGTLDLNNKNVSTGQFVLTVGTKTLTMGSGTMSLIGTGTVWDTVNNSAGLTFNANTSTIKITDTSNTANTFNGGGFTFNNVWWSRGASTASNTIVSSNTFNDFKDDGSVAHSILFTAGTTQTVTTFTVSGNAGNLITLNSTSTATFTLTKSSGGNISCDYLNIQHSVTSPVNAWWFAGNNSVNNQNVISVGNGWIFNASASEIRSVNTITGISTLTF